MQQLFRTLATLFMGAVMAAGGYVAALVVPQLQAGTDRLPSPAALFDATTSQSPTEAADSQSELSLPAAADDWFGSFADAAGDVVSTATDSRPSQFSSRSSEQPIEQDQAASPFSKFAAAIKPGTTATEPFGVAQTKTSLDDAFASAVATTLDETTALARTAAETALVSPSPVGLQTPFGSASDANGQSDAAWSAALAKLNAIDPVNYRLTPATDGQMRCDVWIVEVTGQSVRRVYSGTGPTPAASVEAAVARVLARTSP